MVRRRPSIWIASCLALLSAGAAIAAPQSIPKDLRTISGNLSSDQTAVVQRYVDEWTRGLQSGDPAQIIEARDRLLVPLAVVGDEVSPTFRFAYAEALLPKCRNIIRTQEAMAQVNAVIVCGELGTEKALEEMLEHVSVADEPRVHVRLAASRACRSMIANARTNFNQRMLDRGLLDLANAAGRETSAPILRHQLGALMAADSPNARRKLAKAVDGIMKTIDRQPEGPSPLMQPVREVLEQLVPKVHQLTGSAELAQLNDELSPTLGSLCEVAQKHWASAQNDDRARAAYGKAIEDAERLLRLLAPTQLRTDLRKWWEAGDKPRYDQDLTRLLSSLPG